MYVSQMLSYPTRIRTCPCAPPDGYPRSLHSPESQRHGTSDNLLNTMPDGFLLTPVTSGPVCEGPRNFARRCRSPCDRGFAREIRLDWVADSSLPLDHVASNCAFPFDFSYPLRLMIDRARRRSNASGQRKHVGIRRAKS